MKKLIATYTLLAAPSFSQGPTLRSFDAGHSKPSTVVVDVDTKYSTSGVPYCIPSMGILSTVSADTGRVISHHRRSHEKSKSSGYSTIRDYFYDQNGKLFATVSEIRDEDNPQEFHNAVLRVDGQPEELFMYSISAREYLLLHYRSKL